MNNKILVVDDEHHILELVNYHLTKEGYNTILVDNGNDALKKLIENKFDAVILDWMLPELNGIEILKWIRNKSSQKDVPVMFLTAKNDEFDTVLALEIGADEYISKPFRNKEFIARLKSLLRRTRSNNEIGKEDIPDKEWSRNGVVVNETKRTVSINNEVIDLSRKEYELLILLIKYPGRVFTRDELLNTIWGYEYFGGTRTVDVHIRQIRKKVEKYGLSNISTVHGVGYKWI
jgi:two-component system alkaline phosphatase synthesis response regulator PhoP